MMQNKKIILDFIEDEQKVLSKFLTGMAVFYPDYKKYKNKKIKILIIKVLLKFLKDRKCKFILENFGAFMLSIGGFPHYLSSILVGRTSKFLCFSDIKDIKNCNKCSKNCKGDI